MDLSEYQIVERASAAALQKAVSAAMLEGWTPLGGSSVAVGPRGKETWSQAILRPGLVGLMEGTFNEAAEALRREGGFDLDVRIRVRCALRFRRSAPK
jgi:hypothetical protein